MTPSRIYRGVLKRLSGLGGMTLVNTADNPDPLARKCRIWNERGINLMFDVGANIGQFGWTMRHAGDSGRIVSFEPLPGPFVHLQRNARESKDWEAHNIALGAVPGRAVLHETSNSESSSFLPLLDRHLQAEPSVTPVGDVEVAVETLATVWDRRWKPGDRAFLKVDAQGFENQILEGAAPVLDRIQGIQLELSLFEPLYEGEIVFGPMVQRMRERGFVLHFLESGFTDRSTGELLQVDALFLRVKS
jgi:FkbM family methyltransferase